MSIDRMDWHYGGDYPEDLPDENGGTHIGMFLAWLIHHHLESTFLQEEAAAELAAVRNRQMTGRDFLMQVCDEKFIEEDLSDEGLAFTRFYYDNNSPNEGYIADYEKALSRILPSVYHVEDNWENYDRIEPYISQAYRGWKATQKP